MEHITSKHSEYYQIPNSPHLGTDVFHGRYVCSINPVLVLKTVHLHPGKVSLIAPFAQTASSFVAGSPESSKATEGSNT